MEKQLLQVYEFNSEGGQDVTNSPRWISEDDFKRQLALVYEEVKEISDAYDNKDMVEVVDGLVDTLYVTFGLVCRMGLQHELIRGFEEIHANNMTKIFDSEGKNITVLKEVEDVVRGGTIIKIGKPKGYQPVNLLNNFPYLKNIK